MILKIIILVSSLNTGDSSQMQAILKAFKAANVSIEYQVIDAKEEFSNAQNNYLKAAKNYDQEDRYITFAIGEVAMGLLEHLEQTDSIAAKSYNCLSIHQYFDTLASLKLDHLIIPKASINTPEEEEAIKKIPHLTYIFAPIGENPTQEELQAAYENWQDVNKPDLNGKYIIVMLPGDAPDSSNNIHYFTKESASKLYSNIYKLWQDKGSDYKIIVQNGPRTGKYNPDTGEIASKHEYIKGQDPSIAIDDVSKYFIGLFKDIEYSFYNFATEIDGQQHQSFSYYKPLLYLAQQNDNYFILPGASVSMMGQIPLYLTSDKIILFKSSSMNQEHEAVFNEAFTNNYLSFFDDNGEVILPKEFIMRTGDDSNLVVGDLEVNFIESN